MTNVKKYYQYKKIINGLKKIGLNLGTLLNIKIKTFFLQLTWNNKN